MEEEEGAVGVVFCWCEASGDESHAAVAGHRKSLSGPISENGLSSNWPAEDHR